MADMLLSIGVDERRAAAGLRSIDRLVSDSAQKVNAVRAAQGQVRNMIGALGGSGAIAGEIGFISRAVGDYEGRMLAGERATARFKGELGSLTMAVGRDFETMLKVWDQDLAGVGGLGGLFNRVTDSVGAVFGPIGARENIGAVNAAVATHEKQTAAIMQQRAGEALIFEQRKKIADLTGDSVASASAEAGIYMLGAKEKLSALQAAGKLSGQQYADRLAGERQIADLMIGVAKRRAAEEADAQREKWASDLDRAAEERRRDEDEKRRASDDAAREARDRSLAGVDARLRVKDADIAKLRAAGMETEADQLGAILEMHRELLGVEREDLLNEAEKAALRDSIRAKTTAELSMRGRLDARGGSSRSGVLDSTESAGVARAFGQVFGGGAVQSPLVKTSRAVESIDATTRSVLAALQKIGANTADFAASYE